MLYLIHHDLKVLGETERNDVWRSHLHDIQWRANPYEKRVNDRDVNGPQMALTWIASQVKLPFPKTLAEAMFMDFQLGIEAIIGDEFCVSSTP